MHITHKKGAPLPFAARHGTATLWERKKVFRPENTLPQLPARRGTAVCRPGRHSTTKRKGIKMDILPQDLYYVWEEQQYNAVVSAAQALQKTLQEDTPKRKYRTKQQQIQAFTHYNALLQAFAPFAPNNPHWMQAGNIAESYGMLAFFVADFCGLFVADYHIFSGELDTDALYRLEDIITTAQKLAGLSAYLCA